MDVVSQHLSVICLSCMHQRWSQTSHGRHDQVAFCTEKVEKVLHGEESEIESTSLILGELFPSWPICNAKNEPMTCDVTCTASF